MPEDSEKGGERTNGEQQAVAQPPGPLMLRFASNLQGHAREVSPFTITIKGALVFEVNGGERALNLSLEIEDAPGSPFTNTQPLSNFPSSVALVNFLAEIKRNFFELMRQNLTAEIVLNMEDVSGFVAHMMGFGRENKREIVKNHVDKTESRISHLLSPMPDNPRRVAWTKYALEYETRFALHLLTSGGRKTTLDTVADVLRERHPAVAPASGEALRKQLERFGLSWRKIKTDTKRWENVR